LDSLNFNDNTYILNLRENLTKFHIKKKWTPINIKTNASNIYVIYLWFANTYI
jgi:hypothetical protein